MKETIELGTFLALSVDASIAAAKGDQTLVQRLTNYVPTLMSAQPAFSGLEKVDEEVAAAGKPEFDELDDNVHLNLSHVKEPQRSILAKTLTGAVGIAATTVLNKDEEEDGEETAEEAE
jgi:hypothetical protein